MDLEFVLISILHGAAGEAFGKMPFQHSQEDEIARLRMWHIWSGLASWLRRYNYRALHEMLIKAGFPT